MQNISKLINISHKCDRSYGRNIFFESRWYTYFIINFCVELHVSTEICFIDFILSHGNHSGFYLRGARDDSSLPRRMKLEEKFMSRDKWRSKNCFLPSPFDHLFSFFEKTLSYLGKKFVYFLNFLTLLYSLLNKKWYKELDKFYV